MDDVMAKTTLCALWQCCWRQEGSRSGDRHAGAIVCDGEMKMAGDGGE
jgi:hypothetical protein